MRKIEKDIPITRPFMPDQARFTHYAQSLWDTRWLTHGGPLVTHLEESLRKRLDVPYVVVYANGHLALDCAFKALHLSDGEAITTPFTYISTANAQFMNGLKPVFCDIKECDCTIDENKIEGLITERTKVIVPVHVYGFPCNVEAIQRIADRHGLKVVYDAAHAFGVTVNGTGITNFGDASMLSFHATKVFHTVEGGAVAYKDSALTDKLISAKNFGMVAAEEADSISFNAKMTEIHAAMGLANLETIHCQIEKRKTLIERYLNNLKDYSGIQLFRWDMPGVIYNYAYFPVLFDEKRLGITRDEIADRLTGDYRVLVRKYFYPLLSDLRCYKDFCSSEDTPIAKRISNQVLTLPLFVDLSTEEVDYICEAILEIVRNG